MRAVWLLAMALFVPAPPAMPVVAPEPKAVSWPAGAGAEIVQAKCLICHGGEMIASQRLTAAQWSAEVTKMTGWGAPLSPEEQKTLAAYLAANFDPGRPAWTPERVHWAP